MRGNEIKVKIAQKIWWPGLEKLRHKPTLKQHVGKMRDWMAHTLKQENKYESFKLEPYRKEWYQTLGQRA